MTVYITSESRSVLKKNFLNLRFFGLVSVPEIVAMTGETYENMSHRSQFLVNKTITQEFEKALKRNRFYAVIYSNPWLEKESIVNLHNYLSENPRVDKIVLLDYKDNSKNEELYELFEEVVFFPSIKKIKISDCEIYNNQEI